MQNQEFEKTKKRVEKELAIYRMLIDRAVQLRTQSLFRLKEK